MDYSFEIPPKNQYDFHTEMMLQILSWQHVIVEQFVNKMVDEEGYDQKQLYNHFQQCAQRYRVKLVKEFNEEFAAIPKDVTDALNNDSAGDSTQ